MYGNMRFPVESLFQTAFLNRSSKEHAENSSINGNCPFANKRGSNGHIKMDKQCGYRTMLKDTMGHLSVIIHEYITKNMVFGVS